ncbi:monocarboxylate transporter 13-like [Physella acuta]|uniref:monocarboxylate transporter 13-like n=1 Tax=Physella acuta TaxID=109671 RepID=UPI0027DC91FB|nr:monocarboxylate transporter 13-like [Physella acuta]
MVTAGTTERPYTPLESEDTKEPNDSDENSDAISTTQLPLPAAPDGGWGWFVVLGAFLVSVICDGVSYCFGVLYSELIVHYKDTKSRTSMVGSIFFGVSMLLGPVASDLITRYGCRAMTITGGLISSLGLILSIFATKIDHLYFTFSCVVGAGFSLCFVSGVVVVSFYFDKRLALATGFAVCGTGVGTVTFAPLMDYLIQEYDLKGLFLIMAGVTLNLVVCGMLFRPLKFTEQQRKKLMLSEFDKIPPGRRSHDGPRPSQQEFGGDRKCMSAVDLPTFFNDPHMYLHVVGRGIKTNKHSRAIIRRYMHNNLAIQMYIKEKGSPVDDLEYDMRVKETTEPSFPQKVNTLANKQPFCSCYVFPRRVLTSCNERTAVQMKNRMRPATKYEPIHIPLTKSDVVFRTLCKHSEVCLNCKKSSSCPELTTFYPKPSSKKTPVVHSARRRCFKVFDVLLNILDFRLLCNPFLPVFLLSNFLFYVWSDVPYMYAADHAIELGVDRTRAAYLVSIIGVFNTLGQIIFGYIGDLPVNLLNIYAIVSAISGIFVAAVPISSSYSVMLVCYACFGFFVSVSFPLTSVLLVRKLGQSKLARSYGILMLTQGVANFLGPPFAGWVSDISGNYDGSFYLSGAFYTASGLVLFLVYLLESSQCCKSRTKLPKVH